MSLTPLAARLAIAALPLCAGVATAQMPEFLKKLPLPDILKPKPEQSAPANAAPVPGSDKPLASVVIDRKCEKPVAPFKLTGNVGELTLLAAQTAAGNIMAEEGLSAGQQHKIPLKMRQAATRMNWLPMSAEKMIGERLHAQEADVLERGTGDAAQAAYAAADKLLADVLAQVKEPHEYEFKIFVLKNSGRNARALPGGYIYLDYPLVKDAQFQGKAYFALGHEIAHVLQRHETRALQARIIDTVSLTQGMPELLKLIGSARSDPAAIATVALASKEIFARFHSDQELQSDACSVRLLSGALPDRAQLLGSLRQFVDDLSKPGEAASQQPAGGVAPGATAEEIGAFVSSPIDRHPSTAERIKLLNEMLVEVTTMK